MVGKKNKKRFSKRHYAAFTTGIIVLAIAGLAFFWQSVSYQGYSSRKIITLLKSKGINVTKLEVDKINNSGIKLSNIQIGEEQQLNLKNLQAEYDLAKLAKGKLKSLEAKDIEINIYKKDGKFLIGGLENLQTTTEPGTETKIPTDNKKLKKLLPDEITVKDINISAKNDVFELSFPMDIDFKFTPSATLNIDSKGMNLKANKYKLSTGDINLKANLINNKWQGTIEISKIKVEGIPYDLPLLSMKMGFTISEDNIIASAVLNDKKNTVKLDAYLALPVANPTAGNINIKQVQFPYGGGMISSKSVKLALDMKSPISAKINLNNVDLSETLEKVSEGKIKATGKINGTFPIIYNPDGTLALDNGTADAGNVGTISVSPELLPGSNASLELARTMLENFHYTKLKISVSSEGEKSAVNLMLEGKNPDSQEERPIKFNINFSGDIMPLIQQSIIPFNDIKALLKQDKE